MSFFYSFFFFFFFFNDPATTEIYTLSLHDALPIWSRMSWPFAPEPFAPEAASRSPKSRSARSEEHTSELQSRVDLVCRLLLEKKKTNTKQEKLFRENAYEYVRQVSDTTSSDQQSQY